MSEFAEVVSGGKNFKAAAKSVGRQTLTKQLGGKSRRRTGTVGVRQAGSRKRSASRFTPTNSAKQTIWSRLDIFTNISH